MVTCFSIFDSLDFFLIILIFQRLFWNYFWKHLSCKKTRFHNYIEMFGKILSESVLMWITHSAIYSDSVYKITYLFAKQRFHFHCDRIQNHSHAQTIYNILHSVSSLDIDAFTPNLCKLPGLQCRSRLLYELKLYRPLLCRWNKKANQ